MHDFPTVLFKHKTFSLRIILFFIFFIFCLFGATPAAYEGSQARGQNRAIATGLRQSHSNMGSEPHLQPTPQLTTTPDP